MLKKIVSIFGDFEDIFGIFGKVLKCLGGAIGKVLYLFY